MSPANDARYQKRWRLDRALGRARVVDARPVRVHVDSLIAARLSNRAIADVAGVSPQVITALIKGQPTIRVETARRLMAVTVGAVYARQLDTGFVPNIGARRAGRPVRQECADCALARPSLDGVWGGLTARERGQIRSRKRKAVA